MSIYENAVRKPVTVILIFIGVVILGLFSLRYLPIDLYPEIDPPIVSIFTFYEGASAADIETNVTRILEDNLNTVSNLKELTSISKDNTSLVMLEFEWGTNLDEATNDIRDAIGRIESYLPEGVEKPIIFKFSTSMIPIMLLSATADESYPALSKILDEGIVNPLNRIEGVGAVSLSGGPEREIQVIVDPRKLEAYNISVEQIGAVIGQENLNLPAGDLDIGSYTIPIRIEGEFKVSKEIEHLVVGTFNGSPVKIADVATVKDTIAEMTIDERSNGRVGARIVIQKQSGANSVAIAREVKEKLPELMRQLPPDIKIDTIFDTSEFIENSINSLATTVLYAGIFVVLVVLFFLGRWRATFIIILTIPVSLIVSFIYLFVSGNTLNIISLSSLSIAIGMVVDDAIVVLENITRHIEKGSSPREAAIYGTNEVGLAVVATTLTVVAVFFPLTLIQGLSGIMFRQLGMIVTLVVIVSTLAALTLTPMLSSHMLRLMPPRKPGLSKAIFGTIEKWLEKLDRFYERLLKWAVHHKAFVMVGSAIIFIASISLVSVVGTEFIPPADNAHIEATVELPMNLRLEKTQELARQIEQIWQENYPEIEVISTSAGVADESNIFSAFGENGSHIINFNIRLSNSTERDRDIYLIGDLMRKDLSKIPIIKDFSVWPGGRGEMGSGAGNVEVIISGYDLDVTGALSEKIAERMENIEGLRDIDISREESKAAYQLVLDREKLGLHGLTTSAVASAVRNRINGLVATQYREGGDEYNVRVRFDEPFRKSVETIENIRVFNQRGEAVTIGELGHVEEYNAPPSIERRNRQRVITVTGSLYKASISDVVNQIKAAVDDIGIPQGVGVDIGGTAEDQQESFADLGLLLILIILLVYIVMASQFESLRSPFIIMFTLPFAFTGVFLALYITGTTLNLISLIGAVMLVGIVVKNGIVLVDYINLLRDRGLDLNEAVISGGKSRLRPVLMTTLTTILGMLPLAIGIGEGAEIWQPMGVAIIGGLTFSTLLTLVLMPVVYTMLGANRFKREQKRIAKLDKEIEA
ncbi:efflux RND transporter permease subunit [Thermophagus xiamenensis]|uniref:Heavy metal efflux pump, CzcA family/hydrophobe/amphiphile efflux-1 (HAE1) family protein n=1 Tax=Thermophagus xiamenensis TaxID=385682 RepID=A0A1I2EYV3_9BACT|nr:efflux RND transporter permease subunit [Thermophagus xiamenensis]SFE97969.1 heavy metal efflux pump, CzcA family/hydrophobe/amphiphile efflux-1 (HAE1) family protein [Thermophagus xiamenensis]